MERFRGPLFFILTKVWRAGSRQEKWTGCFPVKWHIIKDVPNSMLRHLTLENNENNPVTSSRDTQEVLCSMNGVKGQWRRSKGDTLF
ncbi:unnamed protein product [Coffea canephora]|uniref:YTH domain-containing family protein n=1 Tax=Coffea canephora TaxID=49390 RepID=A0A068V368_COFCA|nr:unnamed protein product [Coffea canephora]